MAVSYKLIELAADAVLSKIMYDVAISWNSSYLSTNSMLLAAKYLAGMIGHFAAEADDAAELATSINAIHWVTFQEMLFRSLYQGASAFSADNIQSASQATVEAWRQVAANAVVKYTVDSGGGGGGISFDVAEFMDQLHDLFSDFLLDRIGPPVTVGGSTVPANLAERTGYMIQLGYAPAGDEE